MFMQWRSKDAIMLGGLIHRALHPSCAYGGHFPLGDEIFENAIIGSTKTIVLSADDCRKRIVGVPLPCTTGTGCQKRRCSCQSMAVRVRVWAHDCQARVSGRSCQRTVAKARVSGHDAEFLNTQMCRTIRHRDAQHHPCECGRTIARARLSGRGCQHTMAKVRTRVSEHDSKEC